jgi:hypothetical protein
MRCAPSSASFGNTSVFSLCALLAGAVVACSTQTLHPEQGHFTATRLDEEPGCRATGTVPLYEITAEEMSPLVPMTSSSLEEIAAKARGLGANFIVVRPGPLGPEGRTYHCS